MKIFIFTLLLLVENMNLQAQSVGINEDGSKPESSALLDVKSNSKGVLIPRMSSAERTGIAAPAEGLLVFDNETLSFWYYKAAGWTELGAGGAAGTSYWNANGANIFNNNTGNIGIGTNNPTSKLTILTGYNATGWTHIAESAGLDPIILSEGVGGVSAAIGTSSNHALRFTTNGVGKLSIYPAGEVVVGSNATGSFGKLTVETLNNSYGISHLGEGGNILATRMGGTSAGIGTFSNTNMRIFSNGLSAMFINAANGNIGIGIDFPANKLEVNGTIRSKELVVETANWPDYVFEDHYQLPSLAEVEKFIRQNKHLPNFPAAKTLEDKGMPVGDTQKKMMEKLEELTLYIIQQQKEIDLLKKQLANH